MGSTKSAQSKMMRGMEKGRSECMGKANTLGPKPEETGIGPKKMGSPFPKSGKSK